MALPDVPGTVQVELIQGLDGETIENIIYFNKAGAWTVPDMEALAGDVVNFWNILLGPNLSASISLVEVFLTDLTTPTGAAVSYTTGLPVAGGVADEPMSNNVAPCISFRTALRGRSFRGRNYIGGIPIGLVSNSRMTGPWMTAVVAAYMGLLTVASGNACEWVVVSRFSGVDPLTGNPIPRAVGISTPILSASFTDNVVDSQRKRLPNH